MRTFLVAILLASLFLAACGGVEPPEPVHITISGSTAMAPLVHRLAEAYHETRPYVTFDVQPYGNGMGLARIHQGSDLGMVARPLTEAERVDPQTRQRRIWAYEIARDGIALIVNPQNPLRTLTDEQVRRLFSGDITQWVIVGWDGGDVQIVSREEGSGTRIVFESRIMKATPVTRNALIAPTSQAMREYVATHRSAIGYLSMGLVNDRVRVIALEGVTPTAKTVTNGSYRLTRPFLLISSRKPQGEVRSFLQFATSAAGQAIIRERYAPPLHKGSSGTSARVAAEGQRMACRLRHSNVPTWRAGRRTTDDTEETWSGKRRAWSDCRSPLTAHRSTISAVCRPWSIVYSQSCHTSPL